MDRIESDGFDVVVVGTGVSESILAAAISLTGRSVLHLEPGDTYGDAWATVDLEEFMSAAQAAPDAAPSGNGVGDASSLPFANRDFTSRIQAEQIFGEPTESLRALIDIAPRLVFCNGAMVHLLIQSRAYNYLDFKPLQASFLDLGSELGGIHKVPTSRSEVFQSRLLTPPQKRLLMRFVTMCTTDEMDFILQDTGLTAQSKFDELMALKLSDERLCGIVRHVLICNDSDQLTVSEGVDALRLFSTSLARYGTGSAFLITNYGGGEVAQAFCRITAVHGGLYVLRRGVKHVNLEENMVSQVVTTLDDVVSAKQVYASAMFDPSRAGQEESIARFAGVLNAPAVAEADKALIVVPKEVFGGRSTVRFTQMEASIGVCPEGSYVLYAECVDASGSADDIRGALKRLLGGDLSAVIVRGAIFRQCVWTRKPNGSLPSNLDWIFEHKVQVDYVSAIGEAETVFRNNFPEDEWFPDRRAEADPEEAGAG